MHTWSLSKDEGKNGEEEREKEERQGEREEPREAESSWVTNCRGQPLPAAGAQQLAAGDRIFWVVARVARSPPRRSYFLSNRKRERAARE